MKTDRRRCYAYRPSDQPRSRSAGQTSRSDRYMPQTCRGIRPGREPDWSPSPRPARSHTASDFPSEPSFWTRPRTFAVCVGQLARQHGRDPVLADELAHGGAGPGAADQLVFFAAEHRALLLPSTCAYSTSAAADWLPNIGRWYWSRVGAAKRFIEHNTTPNQPDLNRKATLMRFVNFSNSWG
jgi:hypothetical protein